MGSLVPIVIALLLGAAVGALATFAKLHAHAASKDAERAALHHRLEAANVQLAEMRSAASMLRHDLRGILSPALLTADRLANSQDAAVRKAADILIRCVDRASARLSDKPQEEAKSVLG